MIMRTPTSRHLGWLAALSLTVVALGSCAGAARLTGGATDGGASGAETAPSAAPAQPAAGDASRGVAGALDAPKDLLVIKTGTLTLRVSALDDALGAASVRIARLGGYVSGSQRSGDGDQSVAQVTYRIPADQWDAALVALRGLATKVLAEETQTEEVTGQVVDLGARIANLQATEKALQAIMARATKISDVLEVQAQLTDVRGQIEQLTSQKKHLEEQAAYGTLTVTYGLETIAVQQAQKDWDPAAEADRATASLVDLGQAVATGAIWFGILWLPILAVLAIIGSVAVIIGRRLRRVRPGGDQGPILPAAQA